MQAVAEKQKLTPRQAEIYEYLKERIVNHGQCPTLREIAANFGIGSTNGAVTTLKALERKGWIKRERYGNRSITLVSEDRFQYVMLGNGQIGEIGGISFSLVGIEDGTGRITLEVVAPDVYGAVKKR